MIFRAVVKFSALLAVCAAITGCASDETYRAEQEAGGSLPWNRPQSWEGPGALGSQMNQFNQ